MATEGKTWTNEWNLQGRTELSILCEREELSPTGGWAANYRTMFWTLVSNWGSSSGTLNSFLASRVWFLGTPLVAQWLRIRLPMQGTRVWSLVWEDPICRGATKPVCHNYWSCTLEPVSHNDWSLCTLEPVHHNHWAHIPQLLKPTGSRAHMLQLLSPRAANTEAHAPKAHAPKQEKSPQWEAWHHNEE